MKVIQPKLIPAEAVRPGDVFRWNDNFYQRVAMPSQLAFPAIAGSVLASPVSTGQLAIVRSTDLVQVFPEATVVLDGAIQIMPVGTITTLKPEAKS